MIGAAALVALGAGGCGDPCPVDVVPSTDDPEAVRQWHLPAVGWTGELGAAGVVVAVIDNGFQLDHEDLEGQLWVNPGELPNGLDDDGNEYVDDLAGWDFLDQDADASREAVEGLDPVLAGHGTAAAGILAARTDNGVGVAGACPDCPLMLLRARDFDAAHNVMPVLAEAVRYAVAEGAEVISLSDGVLPDDVDAAVMAEVEAALAEARAAGVVVVASAGNDGAEVVRWPARIDGVLAVAAVDEDGSPPAWTSFGPEVGISAPGRCVFTTLPEDGYGSFDGTSASAPLVAALAARLRANHPNWSADEVVDRILATASSVDAEGLGAGTVDFAAALE